MTLSRHKRGVRSWNTAVKEKIMRRRPVMVVVIIVTLTLFLSGCEKEKEASGIEEISLEETAESGETEEKDLSEETQ